MAATETSEGRKPSTKQVYFALRLALELVGEEYPADRASMSELIGKLQAAQAPAASDEIPF